jgi:hypothetical protein
MSTYSMGFHYSQGKKIGYEISYPNGICGENTLFNVSAKDKGRIIKEIQACGVDSEEITIEKVEN